MVIRPISILGGLCISGVFQKLRLQQLGALFSVICVSCGCVCTTDGRTDGRTDGWMWLAYKIEYEFYRYLDIFHRPSERSFNPFNRRLYLWLRLRQPPKERAGEFQWLHSGLRTAAAGAALAIKLKQFTFGHIFTSFSASKAAASHSDSDSYSESESDSDPKCNT